MGDLSSGLYELESCQLQVIENPNSTSLNNKEGLLPHIQGRKFAYLINSATQTLHPEAQQFPFPCSVILSMQLLFRLAPLMVTGWLPQCWASNLNQQCVTEKTKASVLRVCFPEPGNLYRKSLNSLCLTRFIDQLASMS